MRHPDSGEYLRRAVLREHGAHGVDAVAPGFITMSVRHLLGAGYHVLVEGVLHTGSYGPLLRQLIADHRGPSRVYYLDVSFEETIRRHYGRAEPIPVTAEEMHSWYTPHDVLGVEGEHVMPETLTFERAVTTILDSSGLAAAGTTGRSVCGGPGGARFRLCRFAAEGVRCGAGLLRVGLRG